MITWHPTGTGSEAASVTVGGVTIARLLARSNAWQIEHHGGLKAGPANSVPNAKRTALQELAAVLTDAAFEVDVALRST